MQRLRSTDSLLVKIQEKKVGTVMVDIIMAGFGVICIFGVLIIYKKSNKNKLLKDPTYIELINSARNFLSEIEIKRKIYLNFKSQ